MPHVKDFEMIEEELADSSLCNMNAGLLNAHITALCKIYLQQGSCNYERINTILGALEGAKLEFYRLVAAPYEDKKRKENGDAWKL
jgi:hypothetical protein